MGRQGDGAAGRPGQGVNKGRHGARRGFPQAGAPVPRPPQADRPAGAAPTMSPRGFDARLNPPPPPPSPCAPLASPDFHLGGGKRGGRGAPHAADAAAAAAAEPPGGAQIDDAMLAAAAVGDLHDPSGAAMFDPGVLSAIVASGAGRGRPGEERGDRAGRGARAAAGRARSAGLARRWRRSGAGAASACLPPPPVPPRLPRARHGRPWRHGAHPHAWCRRAAAGGEGRGQGCRLGGRPPGTPRHDGPRWPAPQPRRAIAPRLGPTHRPARCPRPARPSRFPRTSSSTWSSCRRACTRWTARCWWGSRCSSSLQVRPGGLAHARAHARRGAPAPQPPARGGGCPRCCTTPRPRRAPAATAHERVQMDGIKRGDMSALAVRRGGGQGFRGWGWGWRPARAAVASGAFLSCSCGLCWSWVVACMVAWPPRPGAAASAPAR
jgi:hypothetical protein